MSRLVLLIASICLALTMAVNAQDEKIALKFRVYPEDTKIYRDLASLGSEQDPYLGTAAKPIYLDKKLLGVACTFRLENPDFTFDSPYMGWAPENPPGYYEKYGAYLWPRDVDPVITGKPKNVLVAVRTFAKERPATAALPVVLLTTLTFLFVKTRRERARTQDITRRREALTAHLDTSDPLVGKTLGKYLILEKLGEGGMATVYKAVPESTLNLKDTVAVKVMQSKMAQDPEFRDRFLREVKVSNNLSHPNIVRVEDWETRPEMLYLVLEYVPGQTLDRKIPRTGLTPQEALSYLEPVAAALVYAHGLGVVHRDLKPENIMITNNGVLKVMDFGLARTNEGTKLTKTGSALGTPAYMPPEQIAGAEPQPANDQYAFAIMAYELLTGHRPFESNDIMTVLFMHMEKAPEPLRQIKPEIPADLELLVLRMLEKNANHRLPSFEAVLEGLQAVAAGRPWQPPPLPELPARRTTVRQPDSPSSPAEISDTTGFQAIPLPSAPSEDNDGTIGFMALPFPDES